MEQFLKIGQLILNMRHIESVGLNIESHGRTVTLLRMHRNHRQQIKDNEGNIREKEVVISYTFEGRAAQAVNLFFEGEMPLYPGYNGWLYDIAKGMKAWEKGQAQRQFEVIENRLEPMQPLEPQTSKAGVVKLDLSKVRTKLQGEEK